MSETTRVVEGLFDDEGLIGGACGACGRRHFPKAGYCPWCGVAEPAEVRLSVGGTVWACTTVNAAPPGYDGPVPFGFGVVSLPDDGLQVVTRLVGDGLSVGDAVRFTTDEVGDGKVAWAFGPEGAGASVGGQA
jgi:uncharacterized OB-fold protein